MWFFGSMMALYMIYLMIKWGLIIGGIIIGLWLVVAIIRGISNGWNGYADKDTYSTSTYYKPDPKPASKSYNNSYSSDDNLVISGQITVERMGEYSDDIDLSTGENKEKSLLEIEGEERLSEPYVVRSAENRTTEFYATYAATEMMKSGTKRRAKQISGLKTWP